MHFVLFQFEMIVFFYSLHRYFLKHEKTTTTTNGSLPKLYMILHWDSQNPNNCVGKEIGATDFQPTRAHNIPPRKTENLKLNSTKTSRALRVNTLRYLIFTFSGR